MNCAAIAAIIVVMLPPERVLQELEAALAQKSKLIGPGDLPAHLTSAQRHTALGYQGKGLEFVKSQAGAVELHFSQSQFALCSVSCEAKGTDLTPLLIAPTVLHSAPKTLKPGSTFQILMDKLEGDLPKKVLSRIAFVVLEMACRGVPGRRR